MDQAFGGSGGHSFDLMALDSNVRTDKLGQPLPISRYILHLIRRGEFICARFVEVFFSEAVSVYFPARCASWPSPALPSVLQAIVHYYALRYLPKEILVAHVTTLLQEGEKDG